MQRCTQQAHGTVTYPGSKIPSSSTVVVYRLHCVLDKSTLPRISLHSQFVPGATGIYQLGKRTGLHQRIWYLSRVEGLNINGRSAAARTRCAFYLLNSSLTRWICPKAKRHRYRGRGSRRTIHSRATAVTNIGGASHISASWTIAPRRTFSTICRSWEGAWIAHPSMEFDGTQVPMPLRFTRSLLQVDGLNHAVEDPNGIVSGRFLPSTNNTDSVEKWPDNSKCRSH